MTAFQNTAGMEQLSFLDTARKVGESTNFLDFTDLKERWIAAHDVPTCLGLLHVLFKTNTHSAEEEAERFRFAVAIAEGYGSSSSRSNFEVALANKAFSVLADQLPRILGDRLSVFPPEAVEAALKFFRPKETHLSEGGGLQNFPRMPDDDDKSRHHALWKVAKACLEWCRQMWELEYYDKYCDPVGPWPRNEATLAALKAARPKALEILYAFKQGQLEHLLDKRQAVDGEGDSQRLVTRVRWELFTPDCLEKLQELALRSGPTLPWALVAGSSAAKVLFNVRAAHAFQRKHKKARIR